MLWVWARPRWTRMAGAWTVAAAAVPMGARNAQASGSRTRRFKRAPLSGRGTGADDSGPLWTRQEFQETTQFDESAPAGVASKRAPRGPWLPGTDGSGARVSGQCRTVRRCRVGRRARLEGPARGF